MKLREFNCLRTAEEKMEVLKSPARADSVSVKIFSKQLTTFRVTSESRVEARLAARGDEAMKDRR